MDQAAFAGKALTISFSGLRLQGPRQILWSLAFPNSSAATYHELPKVESVDAFVSHSWSCLNWSKGLALCRYGRLARTVGLPWKSPYPTGEDPLLALDLRLSSKRLLSGLWLCVSQLTPFSKLQTLQRSCSFFGIAGQGSGVLSSPLSPRPLRRKACSLCPVGCCGLYSDLIGVNLFMSSTPMSPMSDLRPTWRLTRCEAQPLKGIAELFEAMELCFSVAFGADDHVQEALTYL